MITGESEGSLNIQKFFETLAAVVGEQYGAVVTVKSIKRKEPEPEQSPAEAS